MVHAFLSKSIIFLHFAPQLGNRKKLLTRKATRVVAIMINNVGTRYFFTAIWLAQLGERRTAVWKVEGSNRTNTQGLKITEENVLLLTFMG